MYYFVAHIKIQDPSEYQKYVDNATEIFKKYKGLYLVVDNDPEVVEGEWDYTRTVIIRFNSKPDFDAWYYSDDYQEILKYRLKAAVCDTVLVKGK